MRTSLYNKFKVNLVESVEEFALLKERAASSILVGVDTETTGLSYISDQVVGVCISCGSGYTADSYQGYYLPIRHVGYQNLPVEDVIELTQFFVDNYKTAWFNRNFDFSMLEKDGFVCPFIGKTYDAQCAAHLVRGDSMPALKDWAHNILKFDVLEFSSNNAKDNNFGTTDPRVSFVYAAQDPIITALLFRKLWYDYPYIHKVFPIDNKVSEAMRCIMRDTGLFLDKDLLQKLKDENSRELAEIKTQIFSLTGYQFKLNSNRDKADALSRYVTLTQKTASGQFKVSSEVLEGIDHPLAKLLVKYAELEKFRSSYLDKMLEFPQGFHIAYQLTNVPTGRFSSGASRGNDYFQPFNIQNVPKIEVYKYLHVDDVLGYALTSEPEGAIAKIKCKGGLRDAFVCPEGYVWISADYSAQEMKFMACFSGESNLIDPIKNGEDVHKYVATKMFDHYDPTHRTVAKTINFAAAYGASGYTIAQKLGVSEEEGNRLLERYNNALPKFYRWREEMKKEARRKGFVFTFFGRPRALYMYYNSSNPRDKAYADRSATNNPVQGSGGDLCRIDHIKLYQKFLDDPEFAENVKYANTVHDEINLFVKPSYLKKGLSVLQEIMTFQPSNFPIPIDVSPSVGYTWGTQLELGKGDFIGDDNKVHLAAYDGKDLSELQAKFREENPDLF